MTRLQKQTVDALVADGFAVVVEGKDIVRMTKGADRRVVMADGSQKRGYHVEFSKEGR